MTSYRTACVSQPAAVTFITSSFASTRSPEDVSGTYDHA